MVTLRARWPAGLLAGVAAVASLLVVCQAAAAAGGVEGNAAGGGRTPALAVVGEAGSGDRWRDKPLLPGAGAPQAAVGADITDHEHDHPEPPHDERPPLGVTLSLLISTVFSAITSIIIVWSYFKYATLKRHPNQLVVTRAVTDFVFCVSLAASHIKFVLLDNDPNTDACATLSFFTQFSALSAEAYMGMLGIDAVLSVTNPFTNFRMNRKYYHAISVVVGIVSASLLIVVRDDGRVIFGEDEYLGFCWFREIFVHGKDSPWMWGLFVIPIVFIYLLASYSLLYVTNRLSQGLPATFAERRDLIRRTRIFIFAYVAYWAVAVFVVAMVKLITDTLITFGMFLGFTLGGRGIVTGIVWILSNNTHRGACHPRRRRRRSSARPSLPDAGKGDAKAKEERPDLRPQVSIALRKEIIYYTTFGIRKVVLMQERSPLQPSSITEWKPGSGVHYNAILLSRLYEESIVESRERAQRLRFARRRRSTRRKGQRWTGGRSGAGGGGGGAGGGKARSRRHAKGGRGAARGRDGALTQPLLADADASAPGPIPVPTGRAGMAGAGYGGAVHTGAESRRAHPWEQQLPGASLQRTPQGSINALSDGRPHGGMAASASASRERSTSLGSAASTAGNTDIQRDLSGLLSGSHDFRGGLEDDDDDDDEITRRRSLGSDIVIGGVMEDEDQLEYDIKALEEAEARRQNLGDGERMPSSTGLLDRADSWAMDGTSAGASVSASVGTGGATGQRSSFGGLSHGRTSQGADGPGAGVGSVPVPIPVPGPGPARGEDRTATSGTDGSLPRRAVGLRIHPTDRHPAVARVLHESGDDGWHSGSPSTEFLDGDGASSMGMTPRAALLMGPGALNADWGGGVELDHDDSSDKDVGATSSDEDARDGDDEGGGTGTEPELDAVTPPVRRRAALADDLASPSVSPHVAFQPSVLNVRTGPGASREDRALAVREPGRSTRAAMRERRRTALQGVTRVERMRPRSCLERLRVHASTLLDFLTCGIGCVEGNNKAFEFIDFAPDLFRRVRLISNIGHSRYVSALSRTKREKFSEGASGAFLYFSEDERFIVKTMTEYERDVLLDILPAYVEYLEKNPDSLITRFVGCHSIKIYGRTLHFVVANNVFSGVRANQRIATIHERYDLKGSWINRHRKPLVKGKWTHCRYCNELFLVGDRDNESCPARPNRSHVANTVLKDNDLTFRLQLPRPSAAALARQISNDCRFLESQGIMDYSLLLGVHRCRYKLYAAPPQVASQHPASLTQSAPAAAVAATAAAAAAGGAAAGTPTMRPHGGPITAQGREPLVAALASASSDDGSDQRRPRGMATVRARRGAHARPSSAGAAAAAAGAPPSPSASHPLTSGLEQVGAVGLKRGSIVGHDNAVSSAMLTALLESDAGSGTDDASRTSSATNAAPITGWGMGCTLQAQIVEGPGIYYLGLVDVLERWNWRKWAEMWLKTLMLALRCQLGNAAGSSAMPPRRYARRFEARVVEQLVGSVGDGGHHEDAWLDEGAEEVACGGTCCGLCPRRRRRGARDE